MRIWGMALQGAHTSWEREWNSVIAGIVKWWFIDCRLISFEKSDILSHIRGIC
jgi:hypothetical protein